MNPNGARSALIALIAALTMLGVASGASADTLLRLDGIGPLRLGMTRAGALDTKWMTHRTSGCPLGGTPYPAVYALAGRRAPDGLGGSAQFDGDRLTKVVATKGVRTAKGVRIGTTVTTMVRRYRAAPGYTAKAEYLDAFGATFVTVSRNGRPVLTGLAEQDRISMLGVPDIPVCD